MRSEEHTSELQSLTNLVCRLLLDTATTLIYTLSLHDALPIFTPIEAASFGKPSAVLRWGGYTDTVTPGRTGVFFEEPTPDRISRAVTELLHHRWDQTVLVSHEIGRAHV